MLLLFPSWLRLCLLFRLLPSVEFLPAAVPHGHDLRFLLFSFFPQGLTTMVSASIYSTSPRHCDTTLANLKGGEIYLGSGIKRLKSMASWPVMSQYIMVQVHKNIREGDLLTSR